MRHTQRLFSFIAAMAMILNIASMSAFAQKDVRTTDSSKALQDSSTQDSAPAIIDPELFAELVEDGDRPGLYVTINHLPRDIRQIHLYFSFTGKTYHPVSTIDDEGLDETVVWTPEDPNSWGERQTFYVCGLDEHPAYGFMSDQVETLFLRADIYTDEAFMNATYAPAFQLSNGGTYPTPSTPPPYSLELVQGWWQYELYQRFTDFPPDVYTLLQEYSWDGIDYQPVFPYDEVGWPLHDLAHPNPEKRKMLEYNEAGSFMVEPLLSFLAFEKDSFFMRLKIVKQNGESYYSQVAQITRDGVVPLPPHLALRVKMGFETFTSRQGENLLPGQGDGNLDRYETFTEGQYQMTVRENATEQEIQSYLPDTLPIEITLWNINTKKRHATLEFDCPVQWKPLGNLSLTPGEPFVIEDAAEPLVVPTGTELKTPQGTYLLQKPLTFKSRYDSDKIRLILNPVAADAPPEILLRACDLKLLDANDGDGYLQMEGEETAWIWPDEPLSILLKQKPTGATAVYARAVNGQEVIELGNLLEQKEREFNRYRAEYGDIQVLSWDSQPYLAYLERMIERFTIEVTVEGGIFDGQTATAVWPGTYPLPTRLNSIKGNSGGENNAGTSFEEIEEDDEEGDGGTGDGQRPWLPPDTDASDGSESKASLLKPKLPETKNTRAPSELSSSAPQTASSAPAVPLPEPALSQPDASQADTTQTPAESSERASSIGDAAEEDDQTPVEPVIAAQEPPERQMPEKPARSLPMAAGIALAVGALGAAVAGGVVLSGTGSAGIAGKFLTALKNLLHR